MASVGRRAVVSRLSTAQNFVLRCAGTNFPPKISPCGVQGQIFHQKFRPAVCRDKFFTKNFALRSAGTNFSARISPCNFAGTEIWRQGTPIFAETPKKGQRHAPSRDNQARDSRMDRLRPFQRRLPRIREGPLQHLLQGRLHAAVA